MRGDILELTDTERVERALVAVNKHTHVQYLLKSGKNGGADPFMASCASHWWDAKKVNDYFTSDCIGFALWAYGWSRFQKKFPFWGGYLNTNSICAAAKARSPWVEVLGQPRPGCLVVYPSNKLVGRWYGHVGIYLGEGLVAHCHGPKLKGTAIHADPITKFTKVKGCIFVELVKQ